MALCLDIVMRCDMMIRLDHYLFRTASPTGPPVLHEYRYDSSASTGSSQPDCLSVSSGFATDQYVLGAPLGHRRPDSVLTGAHVARVRERASRGRGKGKGKLAGDQK
ncbi:hypothetical protein E5676_scaffold600G00670 [Cucumis melo var. makuwa]|uniref:Uncharacterized protein n=1 Tax=Cucumis melo var. makuwa TaxID=1194695 RepID=A0A5D3DXB4_CUCMM|nr:hypothetical protein E6C27_scaffold61G00650 [Cucumis melo var. makuwa]TYK28261.1 hypothetical protein E5676_scaffold600G00670 [Cucumis melo var. makuwa]